MKVRTMQIGVTMKGISMCRLHPTVLKDCKPYRYIVSSTAVCGKNWQDKCMLSVSTRTLHHNFVVMHRRLNPNAPIFIQNVFPNSTIHPIYQTGKSKTTFGEMIESMTSTIYWLKSSSLLVSLSND